MTIIAAPTRCRACDTSLENSLITKTMGFIEDELYHCAICESCGTMQAGVTEKYNLEEIYNAIYKSANVISGYKRYHLYKKLSSSVFTRYFFDIIYAEDIYYGAYKIIENIAEENNEPLKILEVGSGFGYFTASVRKKGYHIVGCDLSSDACFHARKTYGGEFISGDIEHVLQTHGKTFDVIVSLEVIEHIDMPFNFINDLKKLLKQDGSIIITTPNLKNHQIWNTTEPPVHLSYFTPKGINIIGRRLGATTTMIDFKPKKIFTNTIDKALPGKVLYSNLQVNNSYFDNKKTTIRFILKVIAKNILTRIKFNLIKNRSCNEGNITNIEIHTIIARFKFN